MLVESVKKHGTPGADILDALLQGTLRIACQEGALETRNMQVVTVDTTVQEKALTFPADAELLYTALKHPVKPAKDQSIQLRQSHLAGLQGKSHYGRSLQPCQAV